MWKLVILIAFFCGQCASGPLGFKRNMAVMQQRSDEPLIRETSASNEAETPVGEIQSPKPHISHRPAIEKPTGMKLMSTLTLPSNATSIRADIVDGFSCADKPYGYYADVENDCQIFHVCLPVTYADNRDNTFRWSFICPEDTIFSQDSFTCMRREDMAIDCKESFMYYDLNRNFGMTNEEESNSNKDNKDSHANSQQAAMADSHRVVTTSKPMSLPATDEQEASVTTQSAQQARPVATEKFEKPEPTPKPLRRKPITKPSLVNNKNKVAIFNRPPLRKETESTIINLDIITTTAQPASFEITTAESKPVVTKFNRRPVTAMPSYTRDRLRPATTSKTETAPVRLELFNQNRKRPIDTTTIRKDESPTTQAAILEEANNVKDTDTDASEVRPSYVPLPEVTTTDEKESAMLKPTTAMEPEVIPEATKPLDTGNLPLEAIEEIPAVLVETEEPSSFQRPQADKDHNAADTVETPQTHIMNTELTDDSRPSMESEKPAAQEENNGAQMQITMPDATTQEAHKQSMGGFKPVDPVMAAEAEALIADFLNTLMKSEMAQQTKPIASAETIEPIPIPVPSNDDLKEDNRNEDPSVTSTANKPGQDGESTDGNNSEVPQAVSEGPEVEHKINAMHYMHQIPVEVIQETPLHEKPAHADGAPILVTDSETTAIKATAIKPISVEDIVELVKERLDQAPAPSTSDTTNVKPEIAGGENVLPIYNRVVPNVNQNMATALSADDVAESEIKTETQTKTKKPTDKLEEPSATKESAKAPTKAAISETQLKSNRSLRSRSLSTRKMDPRKRQFLFKSDAS